VTVRDAIDASGLNAARYGAGRLDRLFCKIGRASRPLSLGIRNCLRRRTRTALTLVTLSTAGAFFISAMSVRTSLMTTVDRRFGAGTYGADFRYAFDQHMLMIYVFLLIVSAVLSAVGSLGLMTATSLNVLERRRELGVLRAIGASPTNVALVVVGEGVFVAVVAWVVAVGVAWAIVVAVGAIVPRVSIFRDGLDISLSAAGVVGCLAISTALAVASSVVPARAAARRSIPEALSYE
jgi:ABC-type antimicrobial peptide transport system permease subunit